MASIELAIKEWMASQVERPSFEGSRHDMLLVGLLWIQLQVVQKNWCSESGRGVGEEAVDVSEDQILEGLSVPC